MKKITILAIVIISVILFIQTRNSKPESIKLGFVAGLSGKYSTLGSNVRNGVLIALEEINYKIGNKKIELIQKDDKQNSKEAKKVINELINSDVKVIIGNTTSSMTQISIDIINKHKDVLLFSPTASSNLFSSKDDGFLRTQVANSSSKFASSVKYFMSKDIKNVISVYDSNNLAYSKDSINNLEKAFINENGKKFIDTIKLSESFETIKEKINKQNVDLIVVVASSIDSAKLIQYLRINNIDTTIMGSAWGRSQDFIEEGGISVEGVLFVSSYDNNSKIKRYLDFKEKFEKRFNKIPSVFAMQAYETTKIIIDTLKKDENVNNLKINILKQKVYNGLQGEIVFDKYGDVSRDFYLVNIKDGKYQRIKK
jgi:branched-chain amino acid transport system substrate-binding protein